MKSLSDKTREGVQMSSPGLFVMLAVVAMMIMFLTSIVMV